MPSSHVRAYKYTEDMKNLLLISSVVLSALVISGCASSSHDHNANSPDQAEVSISAETEDQLPGIGEQFIMETLAPGSGIENFETPSSEIAMEKWAITVTDAEVVDHLKNAADNPEFYSTGDYSVPETLDATPAPGNKFVHISYTQKNLSKAPSSLTLEGQLVFDDGEIFAALGADGDEYSRNLVAAHDKPAGEEQNSNTTTKGEFVFEIPKAKNVQELIVSPVYIMDESEYVVDLSDMETTSPTAQSTATSNT